MPEVQAPVRSYLKRWHSGVSQPQDREQSSRQSSMESWVVSKLFPHLFGPAAVYMQEEKQWETGKTALEESSGTSSWPAVKQKLINQRFFRSLVNFPVLFHFSAFWTGTRINMTKTVQIAPSSSTDPSSRRGEWRKISSAQSLLVLTQCKHARFIRISNTYFPSELLHSLN